MPEIPKVLYRNTAAEFAKSFVEEGELVFRPLSHFMSVEGVSRDEREGQIVSDLKGAKIEFQDPDTEQWTTLDMVAGELVNEIERDKSDRILVKCFSLSRKENDYGKTTIEIFDPMGFLNCLDQALASSRINLNYGTVAYYDVKEMMPFQIPAGSMWLYKRKKFEPDEEFRLSVFLTEEVLAGYIPKCSIKFIVGSLSRFARILS
jgi:hypothetical protein